MILLWLLNAARWFRHHVIVIVSLGVLQGLMMGIVGDAVQFGNRGFLVLGVAVGVPLITLVISRMVLPGISISLPGFLPARNIFFICFIRHPFVWIWIILSCFLPWISFGPLSMTAQMVWIGFFFQIPLFFHLWMVPGWRRLFWAQGRIHGDEFSDAFRKAHILLCFPGLLILAACNPEGWWMALGASASVWTSAAAVLEGDAGKPGLVHGISLLIGFLSSVLVAQSPLWFFGSLWASHQLILLSRSRLLSLSESPEMALADSLV